MEELNQKLKDELLLLVDAMEAQLLKVKEARDRDIDNYRNREERDPDLRTKEKELKSAQVKASNMKKEIVSMKRQLENAFDIDKIISLENELKDKEQTAAQLRDETDSLRKIQNE